MVETPPQVTSGSLDFRRVKDAALFLLTGVVSGGLGMIAFFGTGLAFLAIGPKVFRPIPSGGLVIGVLLVVAYITCLVVPMWVGWMPFARAARWAAPPTFIILRWGLLYSLADISAEKMRLTPFFLLGLVLMCFLGGDLGDTLRKRRERRAMKREAELFDPQ